MNPRPDHAVPGSDQRPALPRWAQALDALSLGMAALFVWLLISTIPRFSLGFAIVSLRSPWRVLLWTGLIVAVRHLLVRRAPLHRRLRGWLAWPLDRSVSLRSVLTPMVTSRAAVLLAGYLAVVAIGYPANRPRPRLGSNELLNLVAKWDAEWYLNIAVDGYKWDSELPHRARLAFFPAYPLLCRAIGWVVGNVVAGGLIVSLVAFAWALTYLFRLARDELGPATAEAAVVLLAFYPFAVFYSAMYTESLFLLAALGAWYHYRRAQWLKALAFGVLIGLTRPNGFLLTPVLGLLALDAAVRQHRRDRTYLTAAVAVACAPILGTAIYSAFSYSLTGDPLMWMRLHQYWGRGQQSIIGLATGTFGRIAEQGLVGYVIGWPEECMNTCAAVVGLVAIWPVTRRLGLPYGAFVALNLVAPLVSGTTLSVGRLTSTLFPLFMWLAVIIPARSRVSWVGVFATLQGFVAAMFFTWRHLF